MKGRIFDIQRFSLQDGPGIRTTVFLKGCPLNCIWCHNPESIQTNPQLAYFESKCIHCGACALVCPELAIVIDSINKTWTLDRNKCTVCGQCVTVCFPEALAVSGKEIDSEEIIAEVLKDESYYSESGGGLTLSGGEPMYQFDFLKELLEKAKASGIATAIETSGLAPTKDYEQIIPLVDLFLFDYKSTGDEKHFELTGVNQKLIRHNLDRIYQLGAALEIRCPLIPGINDNEEHLDAIVALEKSYPKITAIRILPYHNTGNSKYERYGLQNRLPNIPTTDENSKKRWEAYFNANNCKKIIIE